MEPIRVILADFDPAELRRMQAVLGAEPDLLVVGTAVGEEEAFLLARRSGASVLVMNLQLMSGDGIGLLKRLAAEPGLCLKPVICSSFLSPKLSFLTAQLGACGFLGRPCAPESLLKLVRTAGTQPSARGER